VSRNLTRYATIFSHLNRCVKTVRQPRGRPSGRGKKVDPVLPPDAHASIVFLANRKRFGTTTNEVARYLIIRALEELAREGILPSEPIDRTKEP
jgi:hypothetical protein